MVDEAIARLRASKAALDELRAKDFDDELGESWREAVGVAVFGRHSDLGAKDGPGAYGRWAGSGRRWAELQASYAQLQAVDALAAFGGLMGGLPISEVDPVAWLINALDAEFDGKLSEYDDEGEIVEEPWVDPGYQDHAEIRREWFGVDPDDPVDPDAVRAWMVGAMMFWRSVRDRI